MKTRSVTLGLFVLVASAACGTRVAPPWEGTHPDAATVDRSSRGRVGIKLSLPGGLSISRLDWVIHDSAGAAALDSLHNAPGPILVPGADMTSVTFTVGGIPAGKGYTLTLSGTDSNLDACAGTTPPFDILAGATTTTQLMVVCRYVPDGGVEPSPVSTGSVVVDASVTLQTVDAGAILCPALVSLSGTALETTVNGQPIALKAVSTGPTASFAWTQSPIMGSFSDTTSAMPTFTCNQAGSTTLTVLVALPGSSLCAGQPGTSLTTTVVCEAARHDGDPGSACTKASDCAGYACANQVCGAYATSCQGLSAVGATPGLYKLDPDGPGGNLPFVGYCPTGSPTLAPVGLAQAEIGAPPATKSFVGAVGFDFNGVDFGGPMTDNGLLQWLGQPVAGNNDVMELANGSILTASAYSWCCYGSDTLVRYYAPGSAGVANSSLPSPQGLIELFDGRILVGGSGIYLVSQLGTGPTLLHGASAPYPIQLASGKILLPANSVNEVILVNPDGTEAGTISDPSFTASSLSAALQLPDGTVLVAETGRLAFFNPDLTPRPLAAAPQGMTLNSDGTITRQPDMGASGGPLLQLPNGQILFSVTSGNTIMRLNPDGAYVDTFTLPSNYSVPVGMTLDHRGRLLITAASSHEVRVVTFPGCSDGIRNGSEGDIDCGGTCTTKCSVSQTCNANADCASGVCWNGVCQRPDTCDGGCAARDDSGA